MQKHTKLKALGRAFSVCDWLLRCCTNVANKWANSWDYGTFRPPQTHSSNAHAQPSSGAKYPNFGRTLRLLPYFMCATSEGSSENARMRRIAWAFVGRLCDKYHNPMSWLKYHYGVGSDFQKNIAIGCSHFSQDKNPTEKRTGFLRSYKCWTVMLSMTNFRIASRFCVDKDITKVMETPNEN